MPRLPVAAIVAGLVLSLACASDEGPPTGTQTGDLVIMASAFSAPIVPSRSDMSASLMVDPSLFKMGFYRLYLSSATDCSGPNLLHDYGVRTDFDLVTGPTLFTVTGAPAGTYPCLIMRISDILEFVPSADFGPCVMGTTYHTDIYRAGEVDWVDVAGNMIIGTGSDATPMDDMVDVFFSTDPPAVLGRGYSSSQVGLLGAAAVIPGASTFYFNGSGGVTDEGGTCRMVPGTPPEFR